MAKYRVLEKSFINNILVEEGTEVDLDGEPGPNLELIGKKRTAAPAPAVADTADQQNSPESLV